MIESQLSLFSEMVQIYTKANSPVSNNAVYEQLAQKFSIPDHVLKEKSVVGNSSYNAFKRKVRWFQQTLKQAGVLSRVDGERGTWCAAKSNAEQLDKVLPSLSLVGFSTKLGVAIIGYSESVFSKSSEPIHLILTSPPYPLANPRKYGNVKESEYVDWICKTIEPAIKNLADGGSLCLNISNDIFLPGMPARSLYKERLVLALNDRFGLYKMDEIIWENRSKPPGPFQWASKNRFQLNVGWEPVLWFCNQPNKVFSDNRRVLEPHSQAHLKLMLAGGEKYEAIKSDGAYRVKAGSYGNITVGRIPKNVLSIGSACGHNRQYKREASDLGYQTHGAMMPFKLASFLINFLTEKHHLVADLFGGSMTVGHAAEVNGRRWMCVDPVVDYVLGGATRFKSCDGFQQSVY